MLEVLQASRKMQQQEAHSLRPKHQCAKADKTITGELHEGVGTGGTAIS